MDSSSLSSSSVPRGCSFRRGTASRGTLGSDEHLGGERPHGSSGATILHTFTCLRARRSLRQPPPPVPVSSPAHRVASLARFGHPTGPSSASLSRPVAPLAMRGSRTTAALAVALCLSAGVKLSAADSPPSCRASGRPSGLAASRPLSHRHPLRPSLATPTDHVRTDATTRVAALGDCHRRRR